MDLRCFVLDGLICFITINCFRLMLGSAASLSSEKTYRNSPYCAGSNTTFQPACGNADDVIAVESIQHGTKQKSTCGLLDKSAVCCQYDSGDCLFPYTADATSSLFVECSGKQMCQGSYPAAVETPTCDSNYTSYSHYYTMEYYCLPESRIAHTCTDMSLTATGTLIYLYNKEYPNTILSDESHCTCSIETKNCDAQINVYFLHFDLKCNQNQKVVITDKDAIHEYTCANNNDYKITLAMTSTTNYITVRLDNPDGVKDGHFWLGFEATNAANELTLACPAEPQTMCMDCGQLTDPTNGTVNTSAGRAYGKKATYSCDTGYNLVGNSQVRCQSNGSWESAPICQIVDCHPLANPTNGTVNTSAGTTYGKEAKYSCDTGYNLVGGSQVYCLSNGSWESAPTCQIVDCHPLVNTTNGAVDTSAGTTYGKEATYSCGIGYILMGSPQVQCQANGSWETAPTCQIVNCHPLANPINGTVDTSAGTTYGKEVIYSCDTGYTLVGNSHVNCQANGSWETAPTCQIVKCHPLANTTNGAVDTSAGTTYGKEATYSCDKGYKLMGNSQVKCQDSGKWETAPTCQIVNCGKPTNPTNGTVYTSTGTTYGKTAIYSCSTGYNLMGNSLVTCLSNGSWEAAPNCQIVDCRPLANPTNGIVVTSAGTTYGKEAKYFCDTGYYLLGSSLVHCLSNGSWESAPTCQIVDCGKPTNVSNGAVDTSTSTTYDKTAIYSCITGYNLMGNSLVKCLSNGSWEAAPNCQIADCNPLANLTNGTVDTSAGTTYGKEATYFCDTGYDLVGSSHVHCLSNGSWEPAPTCQIADCRKPTNPTNGTVYTSTGTTYGKTAIYSCSTGYNLMGNSLVTCLSNGSWEAAPNCQIVDCYPLANLTNGTVDTSAGTTYGKEATYSCDTGYNLVGSSQIHCLSNGSWESAPACQIVDCHPLANLTNGTVKTSAGTTYCKEATYLCDTGYNLVGSSQVHCLSNGSWESAPTCQIVDCNPCANPTNGAVDTSAGTTYGKEAIFTCYTGYNLMGNSHVQCQANGTWETAPTCQIVDSTTISTSTTTTTSITTLKTTTTITTKAPTTSTTLTTTRTKTPTSIILTSLKISTPATTLKTTLTTRHYFISSTEITTMKPDNDDSDDRLTMILIIVAVVMAVLIGASVSIIALRSRTCRKPHFEGQHSQKVIHNIKVRPITDLNIKGLHPEFRPKDHEYYIEFMDEKRRYSNNFKGGEGTQLADIRMQDININGLHSQLRAKDKLFYLRHPIMKQRGSELYQGTPDVKNGLKAPVQNRVSVDAPEYHYNDTDLSSSANAIQGIREFDNDNTRNDRIELYLKGITDYRNDHAKL